MKNESALNLQARFYKNEKNVLGCINGTDGVFQFSSKYRNVCRARE